MRGRLLSIVLLLPLAACATKQVASYHTAKCDGSPTPCPVLTATVRLTTAAPTGDDKPTTVKDLSDRGQAQYISSLATFQKGKVASDFTQAVAAPLSAKKKEQAIDDRTVFKRNFTLTVSRNSFNPDDRIEVVTLSVKPSNGTFTGWTVAQSVYTTITPGTISAVTANGAEASGDLNLGDAGATLPKLTAKLTHSTTTTEAPNLNAQTDNLTIGYLPTEIVVNRQGGRSIALTGSVSFTASVKASDYRDVTIYSVTGIEDDAKKGMPVKIAAQRVRLPKIAQPIKADITMNYVVRHVTAGGASGNEGKEDVDFQSADASKDPGTKDIEIVSLDDQGLMKFGIGLQGTEGTPLSIKRPGLPIRPLCFDDYDSALAFLRYLRLNPSAKGFSGDLIGIGNALTDDITIVSLADYGRASVVKNCAPQL